MPRKDVIGVPWKLLRLLAAAVLVAAISPRDAYAHAALLHSTPRPGSVVDAKLAEVRLVFSEEMVPDLCHVGLMTPAGTHVDLTVSSDPHDVHAIVAPVSALAPGEYHVMWHAVSADGHPVSGEFGFTVNGPSAEIKPPAPMAATRVSREDSAELTGEQNPYPFAAAFARGIGVVALLSLAGLLVFARGNPSAGDARYRSLATVLAVIASAALLAHLALWDRYVLPGGMFVSASWQAMLTSPPGRLELMRVIAVLSALICVFTVARPQAAAFFAACGVVLTGVIGHPSSASPFFLIPATVIHVGAISLWAGGILSLVVIRKAEPGSFRTHAMLVSRVALIAFIVTALTGVVQSSLLLTSPRDLISTAYGRLVVAKIAGLILLGGFGAYHRQRALPAVAESGEEKMAVSLRYEMIVMSVVIIVAAFLSYTPLPR